MNIGEKIKQLRVKTDLTQEELANRCELSKGFISQVEREITSPSIATLMDILECLGTNLKDFFSETDNDKIIFKKEDMFDQDNEELGHFISWLIPNAQKNKMEPILITIRKSGKSGNYSPHSGEVFGYVLQGSIILNLGSQRFRAKKGESFYYKADAPYYIENSSGGESVLIWVSTPPNF